MSDASNRRAIDLIEDAAQRGNYNCTCQAGGVDAMSIDTDWLRHWARRGQTELNNMQHDLHNALERAEKAEAALWETR